MLLLLIFLHVIYSQECSIVSEFGYYTSVTLPRLTWCNIPNRSTFYTKPDCWESFDRVSHAPLDDECTASYLSESSQCLDYLVGIECQKRCLYCDEASGKEKECINDWHNLRDSCPELFANCPASGFTFAERYEVKKDNIEVCDSHEHIQGRATDSFAQCVSVDGSKIADACKIPSGRGVADDTNYCVDGGVPQRLFRNSYIKTDECTAKLDEYPQCQDAIWMIFCDIVCPPCQLALRGNSHYILCSDKYETYLQECSNIGLEDACPTWTELDILTRTPFDCSISNVTSELGRDAVGNTGGSNDANPSSENSGIDDNIINVLLLVLCLLLAFYTAFVC